MAYEIRTKIPSEKELDKLLLKIISWIFLLLLGFAVGYGTALLQNLLGRI